MKHKKPFITFVMCLKNRSALALDSIASLQNQTYADFNMIIVEDTSDDAMTIPTSMKDDRLCHYEVDTDDRWNRSKLLNFGFKRSKTPLVGAWDCDFRFDMDFVALLRSVVDKMDWEKNFLRIQCIETHDCTVNGTHMKAGDVRGAMWVYALAMVKKVHGYDEQFVGWGHEEMDFHHRCTLAGFSPVESASIDSRLHVKHLSHSDDLRDENTWSSAHQNYFIRIYNQEHEIMIPNGKWGEIEHRRLA